MKPASPPLVCKVCSSRREIVRRKARTDRDPEPTQLQFIRAAQLVGRGLTCEAPEPVVICWLAATCVNGICKKQIFDALPCR